MHRPGHVARRLSISPATLRVWSNQFSDSLSDKAQQTLTGTRGHAQRRYTELDIQTLQRVKILLSSGLTYAEVREQLKQPPTEAEASASASDPVTPEPTPASEAETQSLVIPEQARAMIAGLQAAVTAQERHIQTLESQLERAEARALKSEQDAAELRKALLDTLSKSEPQRPPRRPWWKFWERDE